MLQLMVRAKEVKVGFEVNKSCFKHHVKTQIFLKQKAHRSTYCNTLTNSHEQQRSFTYNLQITKSKMFDPWKFQPGNLFTGEVKVRGHRVVDASDEIDFDLEFSSSFPMEANAS